MKKILLILMLALQACGQTGPLYFPDEQPPIHVEPEPEEE
jgi:predicted small lipoprotein YifL